MALVMILIATVSQSTPGSSEMSTSRINHPPDDTNDSRTHFSAPDPSMPQMFGFFADIIKQQNELIRQVTQLGSSV